MSLLSKIALDTKAVTKEFDAIPGFTVEIGYLSRPLLAKMQEESMVPTIDEISGQTFNKQDQDKFLARFVDSAILGWSGLTYKGLEKLILIDTSQIKDLDTEIPYTKEDAVYLLRSSKVFDAWINREVYSLETFREEKKTDTTE